MPNNILSRKARTFQAIALVIVGYFAYSVADLCSKILQEQYSIYQILGISSAFGLGVTGVWLYMRHGAASFFPVNLKLHLLRAFLVLGVAYFMVRSLNTLPLADFYGIVFITPFLVMIFAAILLKETVGWRRVMAAMVGFAGVIVLASPQFDHIGEGVVCALLGALCAALNMITLRKIGQGAPLPLYGFYVFAVTASFTLIAMMSTGTYEPITAHYLPYFLIHGPIIVLGVVCLSSGVSKSPETAIVAPFQYTQIIWGVLFGWIFFHVMPTQTTWAGLSMIIGAGLYSLWREYRHNHHLD